MSEQKPLKVIAGAPDKPLIIGDIQIPCYVLEDETRVITQAGFQGALGRSLTPTYENQIAELPVFLSSQRLKSFISKDLMASLNPIKFRSPTGGKLAIGYDARLLPQVCEVYLKARDAGVLLTSQAHIVVQADILMRGLATVGIITLVDEATGYQRIQERALAKILEKFIDNELQKWTKTFPYEFYKQIFRLRGWKGPNGVKRPQVIGHYTNDFVYDRLAPGILEELRRINPRLPSGELKNRHHQWFTEDFGHPKLREQLAAVIAIMRLSTNWDNFVRNINKAFPRRGKNFEIPFDDE